MRLNNKGLLLCLALTGCVGGGGPPPLETPEYGDAPMARAADAMPPSQAAPPLQDDESRDAPPPSTGPSGTSDRGATRRDELGIATLSADGGYIARMRGMAPGSVVEVTSLQTGRVTLAIVAPGAPPPNAQIELSPAVAGLIGTTDTGGVRVRRVTPSPTDQTALMNGRAPSPRLATPPALLAGLRAQFDRNMPPPSRSPHQAGMAARPIVAPARAAPAPVATRGPGFYVQVAAFGSADRAAALARSLGGSVSPAGSLYRVRLGPYATSDVAAKARAAAAARGYPDARVVRDN